MPTGTESWVQNNDFTVNYGYSDSEPLIESVVDDDLVFNDAGDLLLPTISFGDMNTGIFIIDILGNLLLNSLDFAVNFVGDFIEIAFNDVIDIAQDLLIDVSSFIVSSTDSLFSDLYDTFDEGIRLLNAISYNGSEFLRDVIINLGVNTKKLIYDSDQVHANFMKAILVDLLTKWSVKLKVKS